MEKIVALVSAAPQARSANDDDFADRLSSRYSVVLLVVFAVVVSANQYIGSPITCWAPVHFTGSHTKFATSFCWVRNTYYLPWDDQVPYAHEDEKRQTVTYYQWIPFILLGQAILFYLPTIIWHGLNSKAGVDADNILECAHSFSRAEKIENRERTLRLLTNQMDRFLKSRDQDENDGCHCDLKHLLSATCCRICGRRLGNYLVILFMVSKVFYIANAIGQLFVLSEILSISYSNYGFDVMSGMVADHDWTESAHVAFPRVTFCDFDVRRLGNVHRYTVQCVLPLNLYNEKIYMFIWFWLIFVAVVSMLSFFVWLIRFLFRSDRRMFINNHLKMGDKVFDKNDKKLCNKFLNNYLKQDGAFLLRLIAHNTNSITTTEVTCAISRSPHPLHSIISLTVTCPAVKMYLCDARSTVA
ncbi:hypothetical protein CAPTEDRAFT_194468 [Capitella teleta]|uniref:Innexin n=1 Tax=Capitella teleta TaxID=283909 RepID=R7UTT6_CAPTE|nr:hypothetical protein CAPTEDRAFT_194468 [Capitella teleta]|eukprot:ELU06821.1 hypothetical protein CAPTEDRAFT_194468 [Capitella teleta]